VHPSVSEEYIAQDFHNILQKRFDIIDKLVIAAIAASGGGGNAAGSKERGMSNGAGAPLIPTLVINLASSDSTDIDNQVQYSTLPLITNL